MAESEPEPDLKPPDRRPSRRQASTPSPQPDQPEKEEEAVGNVAPAHEDRPKRARTSVDYSELNTELSGSFWAAPLESSRRRARENKSAAGKAKAAPASSSAERALSLIHI